MSRKNPWWCCGTLGKNYPLGPKAGCLCNNCLPPSYDVSTYFLSHQTREEFKDTFNKQIPDDERIMQAAVQIASQITNPCHQNALPCVLCGQGHNGIDHWLRFCPVPTLTLNVLLKQKGWISINFQQFSSKEHAIVQCWVFFHLRRYLRELGAFDHDQTIQPQRNLLKSIHELANRVYPSLPTRVADLLQPPQNIVVTGCLTPAAIAAQNESP